MPMTFVLCASKARFTGMSRAYEVLTPVDARDVLNNHVPLDRLVGREGVMTMGKLGASARRQSGPPYEAESQTEAFGT